ncbi:uncharacterized protein HD556DRAFT_1302544 [Suillus plorans]|uniref:Uncharacterized protein n=1 Tax=Suillus plorans TaxID=116603 RepID=A0A9P7E3C6_9AGAM|nr:uncharacterized protein HD556DRAFT_1302544 [Suillus plorans]KAG1810190.1 hypothetical protein HD556DRAFT_1302544 [Suillus plorans]
MCSQLHFQQVHPSGFLTVLDFCFPMVQHKPMHEGIGSVSGTLATTMAIIYRGTDEVANGLPACGDDINSIKEKIVHWCHFLSINPLVLISICHILGFNNKHIGKLLCSENYDYSDPFLQEFKMAFVTVSIPSIIYVVTLGSMSCGHKSQFSYKAFYNNIVRTTFEALDDGKLAALHIFSDIIDCDKGDEGEDSVITMMKAQTAARRAATSTV